MVTFVQNRGRFLFAFALAFALCGCTLNRHYIDSPGTSQAIRVESGDRWFMDLEEDAEAGYRWYGTCGDNDVDVIIDHDSGTAEVTIRVHRGYDGPSAVIFVYKRPGGKPSRQFAITLYKRTGDCAVWE